MFHVGSHLGKEGANCAAALRRPSLPASGSAKLLELTSGRSL